MLLGRLHLGNVIGNAPGHHRATRDLNPPVFTLLFEQHSLIKTAATFTFEATAAGQTPSRSEVTVSDLLRAAAAKDSPPVGAAGVESADAEVANVDDNAADSPPERRRGPREKYPWEKMTAALMKIANDHPDGLDSLASYAANGDRKPLQQADLERWAADWMSHECAGEQPGVSTIRAKIRVISEALELGH